MYLDLAADGAAFGAYVSSDGSRFRAAVVGLGDHPLIAVRDDDAPPGRSGDVRTEGLWAALTCETQGEHWSAGMEAFAVGYDDPAGALGDEWGDRVALGFDLEWERDGSLWRVTGDLLVGDATIAIDTFGAVVADGTPPLVIGRVGSDAFTSDELVPELETRWAAPVKGTAIPRALCTLPDGVAWAGEI